MTRVDDGAVNLELECDKCHTKITIAGPRSNALYQARQRGWDMTYHETKCPQHSGLSPHNQPYISPRHRSR